MILGIFGQPLVYSREGKNSYVCLDPVLQFNHQSGVSHIPLHGGQRSKTCVYTPFYNSSCVDILGGHSPVSLKAIPAVNRRYPALDQEEMLTCIKQLNGDEEIALDQWIMTNLTDREFRKKVVGMLTALSHPFSYESVESLLRIGDIHSANVE